MARQTIMFSSQIIALAYDDTTDIFELMSRWQKEFDNVVDYTTTGRDTMSFPAALQHLKEEVQMLTSNKLVTANAANSFNMKCCISKSKRC